MHLTDRSCRLNVNSDLKDDMQNFRGNVLQFSQQSWSDLEYDYHSFVVLVKDLLVMRENTQKEISVLIKFVCSCDHLCQNVEESYRIFLWVFELLLVENASEERDVVWWCHEESDDLHDMFYFL